MRSLLVLLMVAFLAGCAEDPPADPSPPASEAAPQAVPEPWFLHPEPGGDVPGRDWLTRTPPDYPSTLQASAAFTSVLGPFVATEPSAGFPDGATATLFLEGPGCLYPNPGRLEVYVWAGRDVVAEHVGELALGGSGAVVELPLPPVPAGSILSLQVELQGCAAAQYALGDSGSRLVLAPAA